MSNFILVESTVTHIDIVPVERQAYTIEEAAERVSIHPELIRHYCQMGLLGQARAEQGADLRFDDDALYAIRRIEHFRQQHGLNLKTLPFVIDLLEEVERLRQEMRYLRVR